MRKQKAGATAPKLARVTPAPDHGKNRATRRKVFHIGRALGLKPAVLAPVFDAVAPEGAPKPQITMRRFLTDPQLLGAQFGGPSWRPHRVLLMATMGEELDAEECAIFKRFTKRDYVPGARCQELWIVAGRRSGKSRCIAALVAYFSIAFDLTDRLAPNEHAVIGVLSATRSQSKKVFEYVEGIFTSVELFKPYVASITREEILLNSQIAIQIKTADYRTIRGGTAWLYIIDELAFIDFGEFSVSPDSAILDACRPALLSLGGLLAIISTPYAKKGELWNTYKKEFGPDGDPLILIAHGSTQEWNSTIDPKFLARMQKKDELNYRCEILALFRDDITSYVPRELVEGLKIPGRDMLPAGDHLYCAFTDMAGGSGGDSAVTCIGHQERTKDGHIIVIDRLVITGPPFNAERTVAEHGRILNEYRCDKTIGDRYTGSVYQQLFSKFVQYEFSELSKSELYSAALTFLTSGKVQLLDCDRLINELCSLERRVARGSSRESIDAPHGMHEDVANAVCGLIATIGDANELSEYFEWLNSSEGEAASLEWQLKNAQRYGETIFPAGVHW